MENKIIEKRLKKLEEEVKILWRTIKERDNFIFGVLSKKVGKLEKKK